MLVTDSLPFGNDYDQTLLPCSPESIMATDAAAKIVLETHVREDAMRRTAEQDGKVWISISESLSYIYIYTHILHIHNLYL